MLMFCLFACNRLNWLPARMRVCNEFRSSYHIVQKCLAVLLFYDSQNILHMHTDKNKKLSYCWETVRRESMPRIAEMDVEMTT